MDYQTTDYQTSQTRDIHLTDIGAVKYLIATVSVKDLIAMVKFKKEDVT